MENRAYWMVDFYDLTVSLPQLEADGLADLVDVHKRTVRNGARHGTPLVMRTSGELDARVNLFFRTGPMAAVRVLAGGVVEIPGCFGRSWDTATPGDVEAFKDWRLTDLTNDARVMPGTFDADRAALNCFYSWACGRFGVA